MLDMGVSTNKFANWTKVVIVGCDGAAFQGNNANPVKSKNESNLYFRGSVNTRSAFSWVDSQVSLNSAKKIVLAGTLAGGVGVFLWIDYLRGLVSDPKKVYGIADSALYKTPDEVN